MAEFPHLPLTRKLFGAYNFARGGNSKKSDSTLLNLENRGAHGASLNDQVDKLKVAWDKHLQERSERNLPEIFPADIKPIFLQVDSESFSIESLRHWGIEILSEETDGYIIGVSADDCDSLSKKIEQFLDRKGRYKDTAAKLWQINDGLKWRIDQILTPELSKKWDLIDDEIEYMVYAGIACHAFLPDFPDKKDYDEANFLTAAEAWDIDAKTIEQQREEEGFRRQDALERMVTLYDGEFIESYIDFNDSFYTSFRIVGRGLKILS